MKTKDDNNLCFLNICVFCVYLSVGNTRGPYISIVSGPSRCDWHLLPS